MDRSDARIAEVVDACYELFIDLDAERGRRSSSRSSTPRARAGRASLNRPGDGELPDCDSLEPLFDTIRATVPAPSYDPAEPLRAQVTNLDASSYLGRIALCRVFSGEIAKGQQAAWCRRDGTIQRVKITELFRTEALDRVPAAKAGPGDIIAVAGIADIMIGETLADPDDPRPLPLITVDEPAISMTHRRQHLARWSARSRARRSRPGWSRTGWTGNWSATCRCWCCRPSAPTPGRSRAAASWPWPCWSRLCAGRATS